MKNNLIVLCLLSLSIPSAMAQFRVKGKITSQANQVAPYATIALIAPNDSSIIKGAISDEYGVFEIDNVTAGTYLLNVQYVGHTKKWVSSFVLNDSTPVADLGTILLEEGVENLMEVTVKGQRSLVEQKGDRMILNVEKSVIAKGNKVNDLLKYAPLVRVTSDGIKVVNKGNVLILVDGRQTGQGALSAFLQNFSAEDILKIEVLDESARQIRRQLRGGNRHHHQEKSVNRHERSAGDELLAGEIRPLHARWVAELPNAEVEFFQQWQWRRQHLLQRSVSRTSVSG